MKIKIIDKHIAKCYMDTYDLEELNISIEDMKESIRDNSLQHDMIDKIMSIIENINEELIYNGQEPFVKDFSLVSVHIVVMANDTIELTINTRPANIPSNIKELPMEEIEDMMENIEEVPMDEIENMLKNGEDIPPMPKFLENIVKSALGLPVDWEDYNNNYNLQQSKPIKEIDTRKISNDSFLDKNDIVFTFKDFNSIMTFIQELPNIETSKLLKYEDKYYLCMDDLSENDKKIINYARYEFYINKSKVKIPTIEFLNEHATIIIKDNAIEKLKKI